MNLARLSIENNRITWFLLLMVILMGYSLFQGLSRDSMPPMTIRVATVVTYFPGASPERVEQLVTDKIEKKAQELPELKEVSSTSRTGLSVVTVKLKDNVTQMELQPVWDRLRRKLDDIEGMPQGVSLKLNDDDIGTTYGIAIAITSDGFSYTEMKDYADKIRDDLIRLDDAAAVELNGEQEERIFIEVDDARLAEYGLTGNRLQAVLAELNIVTSGGQISLGEERITLEPSGNYSSLDDIKNTLIPIGSANQRVFLGDIAEVRRAYVDPASQIVKVNGLPAISLNVSLIDGANIIQLGKAINDLVNQWQRKLPIGLELQRIVSMDTYIDEKVSNFTTNLMQSIGIILVVMLLFLGLRTGLIIASLIPTVTVLTFILMSVNGLGLNQVTLAALIMALGMMVDNAIVVAEAIQVKVEQGLTPKQAAIESFSELWMSLMISTLTSSIAFLAFYLAESNMGDIIGPIFLVITYALMASWLVAMTIITLLCALFLHVDSDQDPSFIDRVIETLKVKYNQIILFALPRRGRVIAITFGLMILSIFGFRYVPFLFFPDSDRNLVTVDINLSLGTKIESTQDVISKLSDYLTKELLVNEQRSIGVTGWASYIGEGPSSYDQGYTADEANSSYAHVLVNTTSYKENAYVIEKLDNYVTEAFPQADILVNSLGSGGTGTPIEIKVSGDSPDQLASIGETIKLKLLATQGTRNVKDDWGPKSKKFVVNIDQSRAQAAGVTSSDIATSLQTNLDGFTAGEFREGNKTIPIVLKGSLLQQNLQSLESMNVFSQGSGNSVPLLQVATIEPTWQYAKVKRLDLSRTINVSSELTASGNASEIMAELLPWLEQQKALWPDGYFYSTGGDAKNSAESMNAVVKWLPLSGILIVILLIFQFNSFRKSVMVLITIPLGLIGVTAGLLVMREPFGFMPFLGLISLAGIVVNNAIVLLDRIEFESAQLGHELKDAIVHACLQRFRPILLATFTTILGLLPLYISGGEMWQGMAVCIMSGLLFGTMITLILIPCLYSFLYRVDFTEPSTLVEQSA
ncbi:MAG: efflux RND transporter permease subunit [Gammaproteobacteria bacterium]|nr:efflux RND transporter permease subunit [Gammaproteobacteria bacterium]